MTVIDRVRSAGVSIWSGGVLACGAAAALVWARLGLPVPGCTFRAWTGLPCATCGTTRTFQALAAGYLWGAVVANPLMLGLLVAAIAWTAFSLACVLAGHSAPAIPSWLRSRTGVVLALLFFLMSWGYQVWRALG